jgi:hypothetical protein
MQGKKPEKGEIVPDELDSGPILQKIMELGTSNFPTWGETEGTDNL